MFPQSDFLERCDKQIIKAQNHSYHPFKLKNKSYFFYIEGLYCCLFARLEPSVLSLQCSTVMDREHQVLSKKKGEINVVW